MPARSHPGNRKAGFALLVTITLLAFLVLLLVAITTLTRVETQASANQQQLSRARQNALMALNVALGKLQATAGPDTRVTAAADIVAGRNIDKKYWTGVWDASNADADKNIAWLVSGEVPAGSANVATALPSNQDAVVELVGAHSADTNPPDGEGNRVQVEIQPIRATGVPGFDPADKVTVGNFAWWIGDEGVKARISLPDPWKKSAAADSAFSALLTSTGASEAEAATFSFFGLQRTGIEGISATGANPSAADKLGAAYPILTDPAFRDAQSKVLSLSQLPFSAATDPDQTKLRTAIKSRFHDLTDVSRSLLTDVAAGGLKRDLTAWLATAAGPGKLPQDTDYILPPGYTLPADPAERYGLPRWGIIRSYANIVADNTVRQPIHQTDEQQGLYPIATFGRLGIAVSCEGEDAPLKLHFFPYLVLWNPTNVPIGGTYEFCFGFPGDIQAFFKFDGYAAANELKLRANLSEVSLTDRVAPLSSIPAVYFRFRVETPAEGIAPGQSLAFTLSRDGYHPYVPGDPNNPMRANNPIAPDNSVTLDGPTMSAEELTKPLYLAYRYGEAGMLLCPVPTSSNPTSAQLLESAYQGSRIANGFGGAYGLPAEQAAQPAAAVTAPTLDYRIALRMSKRKDSTNETPRWLANLNPRSNVFSRRRSHYVITTVQNNVMTPAVSGNEASAVEGADPAVLNGAVTRSALFEFQPPDIPLFSIAQLQHAGLSLVHVNPAYAVGNAVADYYTPLEETSVAIAADSKNPDSLRRIYDLSYLLNQTLWDRYFFSTVPNSLTSASQLTANYRLPNSRYEFHWHADPAAEFGELKTTDGAAAHLLVNGGFNVNSTSVQAWRALLYSHNNADPSDPVAAAFSRFTQPRPGTSPNAPWNGWRVLTEAQLDNLAEHIVEQVKARGPFLSLADFVNRSLVDNPDTAEDERLKGALQAALDAPTSNLNTDFPFRPTDDYYRLRNYPDSSTDDQKERYRGGPDTTAPYASMAAFVPGFLTQADLLNAIGPTLTARSDTFRIRTYGSTVNPVTGSTMAQAWCEAIVQRLPDYMEESDAPTVAPASASTLSQNFGRRFKIVSFRWLSPSEI